MKPFDGYVCIVRGFISDTVYIYTYTYIDLNIKTEITRIYHF